MEHDRYSTEYGALRAAVAAAKCSLNDANQRAESARSAYNYHAYHPADGGDHGALYHALVDAEAAVAPAESSLRAAERAKSAYRGERYSPEYLVALQAAPVVEAQHALEAAQRAESWAFEHAHSQRYAYRAVVTRAAREYRAAVRAARAEVDARSASADEGSHP